MDTQGLSVLLVRVIRLVIVAVVVVAFSYAMSWLAPALLAIRDSIRLLLARYRARLISEHYSRVQDRFHTFWEALAREPQMPLVTQLARVTHAVEEVGQTRTAKLEGLQRQMGANLAFFKEASAVTAAPLDLDKLRLATQTAREQLGLAIVFTAMIVILSAINSFLLNIYFQETLGRFPLLPYPLPQIEAAHVLAVLFAFMEVMAGMMMHFFESYAGDSTGARFFRMVPWLAVGSLCLVEVYAYALLSSRMNMASRLEIDPNSAFYPIARYFLAFFGAVITVLLAGLGFALWSSIHQYRASRRTLRMVQILERYAGLTDRINTSLQTMRAASVTIGADIVADFRGTIGSREKKDTVLASLEHMVDEMLAPDYVARGAHRVIRSRAQSSGDLAVDILFFVLWVLVAFVNVTHLAPFFKLPAPWMAAAPFVSWAGAIAIALAVTAFGYLFKDAMTGSRYAMSATAVVGPGKRGFALPAVAIVGLTVAAVVSSAAAVERQVFATSLTSIAYGILLVIALTVTSFRIDASLVAMCRGLYLLSLALAMATVAVMIGATLVLDVMLVVLGVAIRLSAVIGDTIRGRPGPEVTA